MEIDGNAKTPYKAQYTGDAPFLNASLTAASESEISGFGIESKKFSQTLSPMNVLSPFMVTQNLLSTHALPQGHTHISAYKGSVQIQKAHKLCSSLDIQVV